MDDQSKKLRLTTIVGTGLLALTSVLGTIGTFADLLDRFDWFWILLLGVNVCAIASVIYATRIALQISQSSREAESLTLSSTRAGLEAKIASLWNSVKAEQCRQIDIMGLSLRRDLFKRDAAFWRWLLASIKANPNLAVRIMLTDPQQQEIVRLREYAERGNRTGNHLVAACTESLETLQDIVLTVWTEQRKRRPVVVLVTEIPIQQWLLRIDDVMVVSLYLQHHTGASGPTFELKRGSKWFDVFDEQFKQCFALHSHNLFPHDDILAAADRSRAKS